MAAVLFTDLVGSTELLSRLGEAAYDGLRRAHFAALREAIARSGGVEVKTTGDGLLATFSAAADAVACAVAMQQAVDVHSRTAGARLAIRVGVSVGDVSFEDGDVFGTPVVEAARLVAAAGGGHILATSVVRAIAGGRCTAPFTDVGCLELKGLPVPVAACEVTWEPLPVSPVPLPSLLTDMGRIFVGRDAELERLALLWKEASAGEMRVALLAGEPGVGKTRLAAEQARRVYDEGATVLAGRCDEDLGVPYQPFVEALRHFMDHAAGLSERLGRYGGELTRLVPELGERVPGLPGPLPSDPETERYRLFEAVTDWLAVASVEEPLLLVLDDLQWAAKPTLLLLRHVVRAGSGRIQIVGTYRDSELTHDHPLVEVVSGLRAQLSVERLALTGLDDVAVAAFVEQAAGRTLDQAGVALARAVYEETDGNPLFVREVLRHLVETGAVERLEGGWTTRRTADQLGIPEGVREAVGHRLSRLSGPTNQALRVAAVVGPEFELGVVRAAGELSEAALLDAVEEAAAARLLIEVSATRCRFAHALIRATVYESITAARKVALHRKAAEAIETIHAAALDDYVPTLAHHWAKASAPVTDVAKAVDYARRAGDRALALLAHDEAANYYTSGVDLLDASGADPIDPRRLDLLIGRGEAQRRAGDPGYRQTLLDAAHLARRLGDAGALARAALANTRGNIYSAALQVDAERVEALEAAIAAVGADDPGVRARLLATLGVELSWEADPGRRLALSGEALRLARALDDPRTLAPVLLARDYTITAPENAAERLAATTDLLAIADRLGDAVLASRALGLRFKAAMELADVAEAERCLARNRGLVPELGQPTLNWATLHHDATLRVLRGDADAETAINAAHDLGLNAFGMDIAFFSVGQRFSLFLDQGRLAELEEWVGQVVERTGSPAGKGIYANILAETDRLESAAGVFDELASTGFAHPTNNVLWLRFAADCAWLCARLGRAEHVPLLRSRLEPYADQLVVVGLAGGVTGSVAFYLGLLATTVGDWPEAEASFAAAATTHERIGARPWLARTRLEWARMLLVRGGDGDAGRARALLGQALTTARDLGLRNLERRAVALLNEAVGP